MKVVQISYVRHGNALGRAWSNWMAITAIGAEVMTVVPDSGEIWSPVAAEHDFVSSLISWDDAVSLSDVDVVMALKPRAGSLDIGRKLAHRLGVPLVVDVDDPDFEAQYGENLGAQVAALGRRWRHPPVRAYWLRATAAKSSAMVLSNPALRRWYGDHPVAPHCRHVANKANPGVENGEIIVAFVGSVRRHKGVEILRQAVQQIPGTRLVLTDVRPPDANDRENWVGQTSVQEGREILADAHIVAIPSTPSTYSNGQLPAKLMDGMAAGKAIVASDVPPVRWALGDAGILVTPGDAKALAAAIFEMRSPSARATYAERALKRAESMFSPTVSGHAFRSVFESIAQGPNRSPS